tara:strand:- start:1033 stop:1197 length:165 start_codon:yes stop_codon:yes gene_type:complete
MLTWTEVVVWLFFIVVVSLLFFAAFGSSKYDENTIEEYMDNLIAEERARNNGPT